MGSSTFLNNEVLTALAARIVRARRLYGADSAFVIGLVSGLEWLLDGVEGGAKTRELLHTRILEAESGKGSRPGAGGSDSPSAAASGSTAETLAENTWIKGIVKWFNNDKGYGFISTDSHIDVFVHWRDISSWDRSLTQGDEVEFMVTRTAKGFQAINVMKGGQEGDTRRTDGEAADESEEPAVEAQAQEGPREGEEGDERVLEDTDPSAS